MDTYLGVYNEIEGREAFLGSEVIENVGANHFPIGKSEALERDAEHSSYSTVGTISPQHVLGFDQDVRRLDAPGESQQLNGLGLRQVLNATAPQAKADFDTRVFFQLLQYYHGKFVPQRC